MPLPDKPNGDLTMVFLAEMDSAYTDGQAFDGFSAGSFTDMWGRDIEVLIEELDLYVLNTQRAIEATRDSSGNPVGLPIDCIDHNEGDGAGYIVAVTRDPGSTVLRFTPRWTDIGVDILKRGIRRWFSATFNFMSKVILGGTLTNWPATRDSMGRIMLRPIELSSRLYRISGPEPEPEPTDEGDSNMFDLSKMTAEDRAALVKALAPEVLASIAPATEGETAEQAAARVQASLAALPNMAGLDLDEARKTLTNAAQAALSIEFQKLQAAQGQMLAGMVAQMQRDQHISQFAMNATAGSPTTPYALPVPAAELEAALKAMPDPVRVKVEAMLTQVITVGVVRFTETGKNGANVQKRAVPDYAAPLLVNALAAGNTAEAFFEAAGLGNASDYDLTPFTAAAAAAK